MEWRNIAGTKYEVSDAGLVRRLGAKRPLVGFRPKGTGYCMVTLHGRTKYIHRLVMLAFCPEGGGVNKEVNHKDADILRG